MSGYENSEAAAAEATIQYLRSKRTGNKALGAEIDRLIAKNVREAAEEREKAAKKAAAKRKGARS